MINPPNHDGFSKFGFFLFGIVFPIFRDSSGQNQDFATQKIRNLNVWGIFFGKDSQLFTTKNGENSPFPAARVALKFCDQIHVKVFFGVAVLRCPRNFSLWLGSMDYNLLINGIY